MAIVKNGILFSKVNGSIGNVILTEDKGGRQIAREKATNVFNPQTTKQQGNRSRFQITSEYAKYLRSVLPRFYRRLEGEPRYQTARNRFVSNMMLNAFTTAGSSDINSSTFLAVRGDAAFTPTFTVGVSQNAGTLEVAVNVDVPDPNVRFMMVFFNTSSGMLYYGLSMTNKLITNYSSASVFAWNDQTVTFNTVEEGIYYMTLFIFTKDELDAVNSNPAGIFENPYSTYPQGNTFFNTKFEVV